MRFVATTCKGIHARICTYTFGEAIFDKALFGSLRDGYCLLSASVLAGCAVGSMHRLKIGFLVGASFVLDEKKGGFCFCKG